MAQQQYRSKMDGSVWTVVDVQHTYNAWLGRHATHWTLRDESDGAEMRLTDTDEDTWNDLVRLFEREGV